MTNLYEIRKWGNGSSSYEVSYAVDYNSISQRAIYTTLGQVNKEGNAWVGIMTGVRFVNTPMITGKTRKEVIEKMTAIFNEPQVTELPKCMMCGNTNAEEVVEMEMFSNEDGVEGSEMVHICSEDMGCNAPVEVEPPVEKVVERTWEDVVENILKDELGDNYKPHHTKEVIRDINTNKVNPDIERVAIAYARKVKRSLPKLDEYVHTAIRTTRQGMFTADIYNATQDRFYATVTWSTLNGLRQKLNETLSKLNRGDLS